MFVGAALLLLRMDPTERAEIPDLGSAIESVFSDADAVPAPLASVEPEMVLVCRVHDSPDVQLGRLFVSEIFRPPTAPLVRTGVIAVKTTERSRPCSLRPCDAGAIAPARCPLPSLS
jgi:hypothetical protein